MNFELNETSVKVLEYVMSTDVTYV